MEFCRRQKHVLRAPHRARDRHGGNRVLKGLSNPYFRHVDPGLYEALAKHVSGGGKIPSDIDLPSKKELTDRRLLKAALLGGSSINLDGQDDLRSALQQRIHREKQVPKVA